MSTLAGLAERARAIADGGEDPRQQWRTPRPLFDALNERHRFSVDAAANESNHLLPIFWTAAEDGVACLRSLPDRAFVNPPYNNIELWVSAAHHRVRAHGSFTALLLPVRPDQPWWHRHAMRGELHFFQGRIQFDPPPGVARSSNREPSVLVVFDPNTLGEKIIRSLDAKTGKRL